MDLSGHLFLISKDNCLQKFSIARQDVIRGQGSQCEKVRHNPRQ